MHDLFGRVYRKIAGPLVVRRAAPLSIQRVEQLGPGAKRILILCHGNIYRSPLAEAAFKHSCDADSHNTGLSIRSAGFHKKRGRSSEPEYVALVRKRLGLDLEEHRSSLVDRRLLNSADIIIIMDRRNWFELNILDPASLSKTVWLGAFDDDEAIEIPDPYRKEEAVVVDVVDRIATASNNLFKKLARQKVNRSEAN